MLGMRKYTQEYIAGCRSRVDLDVSAYRNLVAAARSQPASAKRLDSEIEAFEVTFFNNMVLLLDYFFVHRLTGIEGKDGNPLNEVRVMCNSILHNNSIMSNGHYDMHGQVIESLSGDKSIKLSPAKSVLKYQVGDEIKLKEADFILLSSAFFTEIEGKYL